MALSAGDYLIAIAELAAVVAALGFGAVRVRTWLLPGWSGAPARLGEALLAIAALIWVAELLGAIGQYREVAFVVEAVVVGLGAGALAGRSTRARHARGASPQLDQTPPAPAPGRIAVWVAIAVGALVVAHWSVPVRSSFAHGMYGYDTTWYHMPFAARFVQDASLTGLHFTSTSFLSWFYPANSELFHSVGILLTDRDFLSPLVNVGWLAMAMLAAWCIGRPWGLGPASLVGACVVFGAGVFGDQPGEARNDIPATAFLLACAAVLINAATARERAPGGADRWSAGGDVKPAGGDREPAGGDREAAAGDREPAGGDPDFARGIGAAPLALAALAAGLGIGTKLSLLAPVGALTLGLVFVAKRRLPATAIWVAGLLAGGGFWFVRNLIAVGNPLPWLSALGPVPLPGPEEVLPNEREPFAVVHYATDTDVWSEWFFPGLADRLGELWPLVLALGALSAVLLLFRERAPVFRVLGFAVLLAAVAYPFTPLTASGFEDEPIGFESNLRYLGPVLVLALALLPVAARGWVRRWRVVAFALLVAAFLAAFLGDALRSGFALGLAAVGASVVLGALAVRVSRRRSLTARTSIGVALLVALLAVGIGYRVQRNYLEDRYASEYGIGEPGLEAAFIWARDVSDSRIATITIRQYPFYGNDLSNFVQYVGRRGDDDSFVPITGCAAWRRALNEGDYDYVVAGSNFPGPGADRPPEADWTREDPAAKQIVSDGPASVFELEGELDPGDC